jgi:hypothetical protein
MTISEIMQWVRQEFEPVELATSEETIYQITKNAIRYWNTHSAFPVCKMFPANTGTASIQMTPDYKNVVQVYPATTPDWILQNYPLWSLLGITVIDNLTSDLIMLSEAFRNYRYYMGTDFKFTYQKSDNPTVGGVLYLTNLPGPTSTVCCIGTKRIVTDNVSIALVALSTGGTLPFIPIIPASLVITDGIVTFTDDGNGNLLGSLSGTSGVVNYTTGVWSTNYKLSMAAHSTAAYEYNEDITSEYILSWLLYYIKALVKQCEGNILRKVDAIDIKNDGALLYSEGAEEKKDLEKKLNIEGRWLSFIRRF